MKRIAIALFAAMIGIAATSCVTRQVRTISDYGSFPDIKFLPPEEAKPIRWAEKGQLHGRIPEDDWRIIMGLLSRIPDLSESERQIVNVAAFDDPPVAVKIQLGYGGKMITFVKTGATTWRIAGIYYVHAD